jgi:lipopolysaccharide export system protein LptA
MVIQSIRALALLASMFLVASPALAERADRDKPVNLEADRITVDDAKKVHVFEGNVQLTQGTLVIRADKMVVTQDANGYQKGVATGGAEGLARFRQKREGKDEYIEGEAERIEHDGAADTTQMFTRAWVKSGQDEVRGQYISFDAKSETYLVSNGPGGTTVTSAVHERVRAILQPRNKSTTNPAAPSRAISPALKAAPELSQPEVKAPDPH